MTVNAHLGLAFPVCQIGGGLDWELSFQEQVCACLGVHRQVGQHWTLYPLISGSLLPGVLPLTSTRSPFPQILGASPSTQLLRIPSAPIPMALQEKAQTLWLESLALNPSSVMC